MDLAQVDLGNRTIDAIPTPGHYPSEVSYYDRQTGLFFSGDFFLPGRLLIDDAAADLASARRVVDFIKDRPVSYVLGGHIELDANGNPWSLWLSLPSQRTRAAANQARPSESAEAS